jgi:hypothetical protein
MTFGTMMNRKLGGGVPRTLRAVALVAALVVIGYGVARQPEKEVSLPGLAVLPAAAPGAATPVPSAMGGGSATGSAWATGSASATSAASGMGGAWAAGGTSAASWPGGTAGGNRADPRGDASRECAPDAGVTEACIFQ